MTSTARTQAARLTAAVALTLAAFAGSVAVAGVAAADTAVPPASSLAAPAAPVAPVAPAPSKADPQPVTYVDGDAIDDLGTLVLKKAPTAAPRFEVVAPTLRTALAAHLTRKGAQVTYDARGRLVIAPYRCDPEKLTLLQPGCVTSLPTTGDRF